MIEITLPDEAWEGVEEEAEALLEQWLVTEGAQIQAGQPVAIVVVLKTSYEVTAPADGTLAKILVAEEDTFARGRVLGQVSEVATGADLEPSGNREVGRGTERDAVTVPHSGAGNATMRVPLSGLRGIVARNMTTAWQTVPRVGAAVEVDMSACESLRATLQRQLGSTPHISVTPVILRAAALTLKEHPRVNGRVDTDAVHVAAEINLGLAVNLEEGVVVPVIRHADQKSIAELAAEAQNLADAARENRLPPAALQGGTFTITNLGATSIDWFTPIVNAPQVAILGLGGLAQRPIVRAGQVVAAPTLVLSLVFDHRAVDGHPAAVFLAALRARLERAQDL